MVSEDILFGKKAVEMGLLTALQLQNIIKEHKKSHNARSLSQILVQKGLILPSESDSVIAALSQSSILALDLDESGTIEAVSPIKNTETYFGRYKILSLLGQGGMAQVFRALDPQLNRPIALKLLNSTANHATDEEFERFQLEAKATARLQHPNIVSVYDIGIEQQQPYLVMDFIEGCTLRKLIDHYKINFKQAAKIIQMLAKALAYAHSKGIIHRDLKPENIMMQNNAIPKIMDFGLAKIKDLQLGLTKQGAIMGTLRYMSPEQAEGNAQIVNETSDIFSLGIIFYEMLTKTPPFLGKSSMHLIQQIIYHHPDPPSKIRPHIPSDLDQICMKMLQKSQNQRYQNMASVVEDLQRFREGKNIFVELQQPNQWKQIDQTACLKTIDPAKFLAQATQQKPIIRPDKSKFTYKHFVGISAVVIAIIFMSWLSATPAQKMSFQKQSVDITTKMPKQNQTIDLEQQALQVLSNSELQKTLSSLEQRHLYSCWTVLHNFPIQYRKTPAGNTIHAHLQQTEQGIRTEWQKILETIKNANKIDLLHPSWQDLIQYHKDIVQIVKNNPILAKILWQIQEQWQRITQNLTANTTDLWLEQLQQTLQWKDSLEIRKESPQKVWQHIQQRFIIDVAQNEEVVPLQISCSFPPEIELCSNTRNIKIAKKRRLIFDFLGCNVGKFEGTIEVLANNMVIARQKFPIEILQSIYGFPPQLWKSLATEFRGQQIIDMTTPFWKTLSLETRERYVKIYQKGYAKSQKIAKDRKIEINGVILEMALIPPGKFHMGSPDNEPGRKSYEHQHNVIISKHFWLQTYETTQQQWAQIAGKQKDHLYSNLQAPITFVSWEDIQKKFLVHLPVQFSLPTEAQWEYACRAGTHEYFWWGNHFVFHANYCWANFDREKFLYPFAVKSKRPNAWGLHDMLGNVWEWCQDGRHYYPFNSKTLLVDPCAKDHEKRVIRGGCWYNSFEDVRNARRSTQLGNSSGAGIGFRLAYQE